MVSHATPVKLNAEVDSWVWEIPGPRIKTTTWNRKDLLKDFDNELKKTNQHAKFAETLCNNAFKIAESLISDGGSSAAKDFLKEVTDKVSEEVEDEAAGQAFAIVAQKTSEIKADRKFIKEIGTKFVTASIVILTKGLVAVPPLTPVAVLFTVIFWLNAREQELKKKANSELADNIMTNLERIRKDTQKKLDKKYRDEVEKIIMHGIEPQDVQDATMVPIGMFKDPKKVDKSVTIGKLAQFQDRIWGNYIFRLSTQDLVEGYVFLRGSDVKKINEYFGTLLDKRAEEAYEQMFGENSSVNATRDFAPAKGSPVFGK